MHTPEERSVTSASVPRGRLLLVDDEPELRRVLRRAMERAGYDVTEAADGESALRLSRQGDFDAVISDVCMPLMTGLELLERLSLEVPELPVLFVSGSIDLMNVEKARGYGAFDFLEKPVDLAELRARTLAAVEEGERRRRSGAEGSRESESRLVAARSVGLARRG
jgi:DNA-binding NtrC family response regulator